jgi:CBS domain-containing protein
MKVRDFYKKVTPEADLVKIDTSIEDIIEIVSQNPASRSVYVVNDEEKLVGIISVREILDILGAKYLKKRSVIVAHGILAKTAADIMRDAEYVTPEDDLEEALKTSVIHHIEDLPVVENEKVIGNLDCFELIKGIKDFHKTG